jgi:predicted Rossmann-fold nucleotide-binding protein
LLENGFLLVARGSVLGLMGAEVVALASCLYAHAVALEEEAHYSSACLYGLWSGLPVWAVVVGGCRQGWVMGMADRYADNFGKEGEETLGMYNNFLEMSFGRPMARVMNQSLTACRCWGPQTLLDNFV